MSKVLIGFLALSTIGLLAATIALAVMKKPLVDEVVDALTTESLLTNKGMMVENVCAGKKPVAGFENSPCAVDGIIQALEQAGGNVTEGFVGSLDAGGRVPITNPYWMEGLCPVNVHFHIGAEHLSVGEYDENGVGPTAVPARRLAEEKYRAGFQCHLYDESEPKFTTEYEWKFCEDMKVGYTYEIHWPHSAAGACGTPNQYQTPFYDGVFCMDGVISLDPLNTYQKIGVQAQVFTVVNDEDYYYPDLIKGMIVEDEYGKHITKYTGSTTGPTRNNTICSKYTPITWQVDRKCHMISASSIDKLCADMMTQNDDMTGDLHAHGARELVAEELTANNQHHMRF